MGQHLLMILNQDGTRRATNEATRFCEKEKQIDTIRSLAVAALILVVSVIVPVNAAPGYHIDSDRSAKQAVQQYGENNFQFGAVVYQATLDKNLWRLTLAAHDYLQEKPKDPVRQCTFAQAYWQAIQAGGNESVSPATAKQLQLWFEEAVRDTENAVKKMPRSIYANLIYGDYLLYNVMGMQKVPMMLHAYQQAVTLAPDLGYAHYKLAMGYFGSGDYSSKNEDRVISELKKALALDPRLTESYFSMAGAYWQKGDYKNVRFCVTKYLNLHPEQATRPDIVRTQAMLREKLGS